MNPDLSLHQVDEVDDGAKFSLIRVLCSVRLDKANQPGIVPSAPVIPVSVSQEDAHILFGLVLKIAHQVHLSLHGSVRADSLPLCQVNQVLQHPDVDDKMDEVAAEAPDAELVLPVLLNLDLLLQLGQLCLVLFSLSR